MIILGILFFLWQLSVPNQAQAPTNPTLPESAIISGNSLLAVYSSTNARTLVYGAIIGSGDDLKEAVRVKYPEIADLLICIAQKESGFNLSAVGDMGKAKGIYQIHTDKHDIDDACAFDFECALNWTAEKIQSGQGYLWTTYQSCL